MLVPFDCVVYALPFNFLINLRSLVCRLLNSSHNLLFRWQYPGDVHGQTITGFPLCRTAFTGEVIILTPSLLTIKLPRCGSPDRYLRHAIFPLKP